MQVFLSSIVAFICLAVTFASADTVTFNFSSTVNSTSPNSTYTADGLSISATGTANLFFKAQGSNETGLGLSNNFAHEIGAGQSITFDLSSLFSENVTSVALTLASIEQGESATVCDASMMCTAFGSAESGQSVDISSLYADMVAHHSGLLKVTGVTGQVLVDDLQATTEVNSVPEPSTFALIGSGVVMMAGAGGGISKRMQSAGRLLRTR